MSEFRRSSDVKEIAMSIIDCDAQPYVPDGCSVVEHQKGGMFRWNKEAQKSALHVSKNKSKNQPLVYGNKLREELAGKPVLNANVLDYLLENPSNIPEEWKGRHIVFWGTIYRDKDGRPCIRCLYGSGAAWNWIFLWLDEDMDYDPDTTRVAA